MNFRADIEGLRGVAVLLVVLAHADVPGLYAGFIGVDVFFVISGFLITGLLCKELETKGRIDYWAFYARRARRLAPALMVMLAAVSAWAVMWLPRSALQVQLDSAFWAALWSSNLHFAFGHFDYFGASAQESLFLHTWSLGVEEQFYLVWPVLAALAWRSPDRGRRWLPAVIVASFVLALALMDKDATSAYFLMPTRLWQLALGAWVFRLTARAPENAALGTSLGWAGIALLLSSLLVIGADSAYPGLWALLPAVSAALLLAAGVLGGGPVSRLLSSGVLRFPGRISYSWYLWHWPVLVFMPALGLGHPDAMQTSLLVLLTLVLGWASYALVEQPVRHRRSGSARADVIVLVLTSSTLAALIHLAGLLSVGTEPDPARATLEQRVLGMISLPSVYRDKRCDQWYHSSELVPCKMDTGSDGPDGIVAIVDSVGAQWLPAIERIASRRRMSLHVLTKSSCPIVDEPFVYQRIHRRFVECESWRERALEYVATTRPAIVIIGSTAAYPFAARQWNEGTARILGRLVDAGSRAVVLAPTPLLDFHGPRCIVSNGHVTDAGLVVAGCEAPLARIERRDVLTALQAAADSVPGAQFLYLNDLVCPGGTCRAFDGTALVYRDEQHLNADFVRSLEAIFDDRLGETVESGHRHPSAETTR